MAKNKVYLTVLAALLAGAAFFFCCSGDNPDNPQGMQIMQKDDQGNQNDQGNQDGQGKPEKPTEPAVVEAEAELVELHTWRSTSGIPNNVIMVKHPNENAVFECKVINGQLWLLGPYYEKNLSVKPGDKFRWVEFNKSYQYTTHDFVEIVVKLDENIVGYAVIEVNQRRGQAYNAVVIKSVLFPQIGGEYQNVSDDYVKTAIEKVKGEARGEGSL